MSGLCGGLETVAGSGALSGTVLDAMVAAASYRAPGGVLRAGSGPFAGAVLASRREDRPWVSADGRLTVLADARLHRRAGLRRELEPELAAELPGTGGAGESGEPPDAALLAAGWRRWGASLPEHLDGDFAFALWDRDEGRVLLARDAAGARPLAWSADAGRLAFASDPHQLLAARGGGREPALDEAAAVDFLLLDFRPSGRTLHAGIARLPPGHRLEMRRGGAPRVERWWRPERAAGPGIRDLREWPEAFRERLDRSVAGRLDRIGGAPAVLLSGGLDSSAVAAVATSRASGGGSDAPGLHLLTHVFPAFPECDESAYAAAVADHLGLPLHRLSAERDLLPLDPAALLAPAAAPPAGRFPAEPWVAAQEGLTGPLMDRAVELGAPALLTGLGGDALFDAARWRYRDDARRGRWWRLPPWIAARRRRGASWPRAVGAILLKPLLPVSLLATVDRLGARADGRWHRRHRPPWLPADLVRRTGAAGRRSAPPYPRPFRGARQDQYEHLVGLAQQAVTVDALEACAARRGLEVFHPLLDRRVAELVLAAPLDLGAVPGAAGSKWLLRRALGDRLPRRVREREDKAGWGSYLAHLLRGGAGSRAAELLADGRAAAAGLVDGPVLVRELERFRRGDGPWGDGLWFVPPLLLELWLRAAVAPGTGEVAA